MGMGDAPAAGVILLVEDSGPTRIVIARILEGAGYRVTQAANASEAVTLIAGEDPGGDAALVADDVAFAGGGFAKALNWPLRMKGRAVNRLGNISCVRPLAVSAMAGAAPSCLTPFITVPVPSCNSAAAKCGGVPSPAEA